MPKTPASSCRLFVVLARDGRSAAVFRRGPSRRVAVLRWWLGTDTIELGQWFKGRIYERRCDLSPDGELLVYFAAKHRGPFATWTAVSRTPFLTALALWPKGDAWGGGGLFRSHLSLGLNHPAHQCESAPGTAIPRRFTIDRYAPYAGAGEDNPILHDRMIRDGWRQIDAGTAAPYSSSGPARWQFEAPEIYERARPTPATERRRHEPLRLRRKLVAIGVTDGPWYRETYTVEDAAGHTLRHFADCDWADWQSTGDLLVAAAGSLYRLRAATLQATPADPLGDADRVADLAPLAYSEIAAPPAALQWPHRARRPLKGSLVPKPE